MDQITEKKLSELKAKNMPIGCMSCFGNLEDGKHEYDPEIDIFYCPALDE
jgi:hypothetical protein